ncbi:MAG: MBOAT family protein [Drouetiella hepatica Uher 2000/2452]|jgi:D-alanyl-lipoteichoic acid acyltransferase DltB (MBOAT superfamily)|uniref:MBOAT family protein n=1 Tax=Drouetiella hepatica Uher 2000/2452 TaxID=904376 RepID=A0A951Q6E3_9CYAN|nr:MBOAT family protein [Drouetiella hepatica Uher 2000/2452]
MLFNSIEFLVFLVTVYTLYRVLPFRGQNLMLLVSSYIFYGWWDKQFLFLILLITSLDFCSALIIGQGELTATQRRLPSWVVILSAFFCVTVQWEAIRFSLNPWVMIVDWSRLLPPVGTGWLVFWGSIGAVAIANFFYPKLIALPERRRKNVCLGLSITIDLLILAFFKYFNFFVGSAVDLLQSVGLPADFTTLNILLPVGISFYTFQTMSYTLDVYRRELEPAQKFSDFALSVCFFPHLVAGPIVRATDLMPQFILPRTITFDQTLRGLYLILFGLFKKVAIADGLAGSVNAVYNSTGTVSWIDVVAATLLFTFQIYCDFSGYTDIARGVSKLFGVELVVNFNLPYFSRTPSEFWQRWHISLSTWLRDYLYISLGGNRKGNLNTYRNLMTTMVLGGLWHGAAWNYVLWGFYQGALLCIYRVLGIRDPRKSSQSEKPAFNLKKFLSSTAATLIFFGLTCYGWLLFRANSLEQIVSFTQILFTDFGNFSLTMPKPNLSGLLGLAVLIIYEFAEYSVNRVHFYRQYPALLRGAFYAILTLLILMGTSNAPAQFIYFQF